MRKRFSATAALLLALLPPVVLAGNTPAFAAGQPVGPTPSPAHASVYFIDLKDGAHVPATFHVRVGLLNMGVSPAGVPFSKTGHHHLLIDAPLPDLDRPIPADDNHIHFGGGQTEFDVTLPPGPHTLQLLLGDQDHVPHNPPVYSAPIRIVVMSPRTASPAGASAYIISPRDGATIGATTTVRLGLRGMGVVPAGITAPNTGHHILIVDAPLPALDIPVPADDKHISLSGGQTETDVTLSPGSHTLQDLLTDQDGVPHDPAVYSEPVRVTVGPNASQTVGATANASTSSPRTPSRPGSELYFVSPHDGDVVGATTTVRFGLRGMGVTPTSITHANSGHHHLLIDSPVPPADLPIPADDEHLHFGAGQTETTVTLSPGKHTLQLELADGNHMSFDPPVISKPITITVREQKAKR